MSMRFVGSLAVGLVMSALALAPARANVEAGALSCRGAGALGLVVTSLHHFDCIFRPADGGPPQHYVARIRKIGVDLGFTRAEVIEWLVFAPTRVVGPGGLAGGYGGVQAGAAFGIGVGANGLVGGIDNSFALQPVSVEAQRGVNVAGGLAGLALSYVPPPRPHHHFRRHRH